ncbi:MAG: alpha/beta hydrolase [Acidimicrobiaceae bacterium]|nr:alpha/beta hydrolase [Acidimicrobiaceae bacterium]
MHGQPGSIDDLAPLASRLPKWIRSYGYDRPGWGVSALSPTGIFSNAEFLNQAVKGVEGKKILIGHSYGGAVALAASALDPTEYVGALLLAPAALVGSLGLFDSVLASVGLGQALSSMLIRAAQVIWSGYRSWGGTATKSFWAEQVRMRSELGDLEHLVGSIRLPISIIHGDSDRVVPLSSSYVLHSLMPQSRFLVLKRTGHSVSSQFLSAVAIEATYLAASQRDTPKSRIQIS